MLGPRLLSHHNVAFLVQVVDAARRAIGEGRFEGWAAAWSARYLAGATEASWTS